jgi:hypothetical protein
VKASSLGAKLKRSGQWPILLLVGISLILSVAVVRHYGESWDELSLQKYAAKSLSAYHSWFLNGEVPIPSDDLGNYGPAYVMTATLASRFLNVFLPLIPSDTHHLIYFFTFEVGIYYFYWICRRWLNGWGALAATLLLATQPLFWGQAFISPKDIPFMAFFLASLALGLRMVDALFVPRPGSGAGKSRYDNVVRDWKELSGHSRRNLFLVTFTWLISLAALFLATAFFDGLLTNLITRAYSTPQTLIGQLFGRFATDAHKVPVAVYIQKALVAFIWLKIVYFLLGTLVVACLYRRVFPSAFRLLTPSLFLAGIALGLTTSIRVLGPLAGLLIALYALLKSGKRTFPVLLIYAGLAIAVALLTWPYLWPDPIGRFADSLRIMTQYPWRGRVLFNGSFYAPDQTPRSYLPVLLAIQFTEPIWPLFLIGLAILLWKWFKAKKCTDLLLWVLIWFLLPVLGLIATRAPLYDNTRQILFILPPVFLLAGAALQAIFAKIRWSAVNVLLLGVLVLPGIVADVQLHPYEYTYYNSFVGGQGGAFRRFEMEYWCISYRQAAEYLDQIAPANAKVLVAGPAHIFEIYKREDLKIYSPDENEDSLTGSYDYAVINTRYDRDLEVYPDAAVVHTIQRGGATYTVIKQLSKR